MRPSNLFAFAVGLFVYCESCSPCRAGVIIPQAEPAIVSETQYLAALDAQLGASGCEDRSQKREQREDADAHRLICGELPGDAAGGASSPESGGSGSTGSTSAASQATVPIARPPAVLFAHWREVALRLPRPPAERLLDPPRAPAISGRL
jgi:hypothetical protein